MSARVLPIDAICPQICAELDRSGVLVLQAEPGAGKTTRVPSALLEAGLAGSGSVLVLEPRRVAARAAADFVARERGEKIGGTVGFQVRFERRGSPSTRLWFATEGVALRKLRGDPFLEDVGVLVLDEFHERHLEGDVVLALTRELRRTVRPDLKIVVMSATLDVESVAGFLDGCPVLRCPGRVYPVDIEFREAGRGPELPRQVRRAVGDIMARDDGDVLVFLPGRGEIRRCEEELAGVGVGVDVVALHGELPLDAQRAVLRGVVDGRRRVVLSTNVAESSVTVDGVTAVIDSGLARVPEMDAGRGFERLRLVPISVASADQRAGRAGRLGPGRCVRLWSKHDHRARRARDVPEILRLDLASIVLDLHSWGLRDLRSLAWLDAPPPGALERAGALLRDLGALDGGGGVTDLGAEMARLPASPRVARLAIEARRLGQARDGAVLAALLSERDIALTAGGPGRQGTKDLLAQVEIFDEVEAASFSSEYCRRNGLHVGALRSVDRAARQLLRSLEKVARGHGRSSRSAALRRAVLAAFPDRVVRRRDGDPGRGVMVGGTGVFLSGAGFSDQSDLFVAVDVRAGNRRVRSESEVTLASAIDRDWLLELFPSDIEKRELLDFDQSGERVVAVEQVAFRDLVLEESRRPTSQGRGSDLLRHEALTHPERVVSHDRATELLLRRLDFIHLHHAAPSELPTSQDLTHRTIDVASSGCDSFADLRKAMVGLLSTSLTYDLKRTVERLAPETLRLPSGRRTTIDYGRGEKPVASARIQELFGMEDSPRVCGDIAVVLEILGPNHRPVQLTGDLASFWRNTYPQIRIELRGRYPKHDWPEDPWTATASSRVRRRR